MTLFADALDGLDPSSIFSRLPSTGATVGMRRTPDPWQTSALRSSSKRQAMLAARQVGKGEVLTARGLHRAAYYPESQIGILTPTLRQSCRLLRRIRRALPAVKWVKAMNNSVSTLMLSNGSEIVAWPGSNADAIRGDTLDLLLVDEAAWVAEDAFLATLPMLGMSQGSALLASTPGGPSGYLFDIFNDAEKAEGWTATKVTADDCPRYSPEVKADLRRALGESGYAVEMECEWREGEGSLFTAEEIARITGINYVPDVLPGEAPLPEEGADVYVPRPRLALPNLCDLLD